MIKYKQSILYRLQGWFLGIGLVAAVGSGVAHFYSEVAHLRTEVAAQGKQSLSASLDTFEKSVAIPVQSTLEILANTPSLDNFLQGWGNQVFLLKPNVEKQFIQITKSRHSLFRSVRFFDHDGEERIIVHGNKRSRNYNNLTEPPTDDQYYRNVATLFKRLQTAHSDTILVAGPFYASDGDATFIAGIGKMDPDIGTFAGGLFLHCDLSEFLASLSQVTLFGERIVWAYDNLGVPLLKGDSDDESAMKGSKYFSALTDQIKFGSHSEALMTIRVNLSPKIIEAQSEHIITVTLLVTASVLFITFLLSSIISRKFIKPIIALQKAMADFSKGVSATPIKVESDDEIGELAAAFQSMRQKIDRQHEDLQKEKKIAETASQTKSEFLANMSHEIRTPMNAVIGLTDLALQSEINVKTRDYLNKIYSSSRSLLRIINDILDFSKIEAGRLEMEQNRFLLREVFDNLLALFRTQVREKNIELIVQMSEECRFVLLGDALRLEQILLNLIGNAVKFTNEGEVVVRVATAGEEKGRVTLQFSVQDTGIGMTAEQQSKLFMEFIQADPSTTRKFGGTGLGLTISQRLTKLMGGQIWVDSEYTEGSLFHFTATFPLNREEAGGDMRLPEELGQLQVLVVVDNPAVLESLRTMLIMFGFKVYCLSSGAEASQTIQKGIFSKKPFDLVLIDWLMPGMDGIQTVNAIKETIPTAQLPKIFLLSQFDHEKNYKHVVESVGVAGFIAKPINCSMLFDTIMESFGRKIVKANRPGRDIIDPKLIADKIGGARALLVEDNSINRQVAREILQNVGLIVEMAANGLEAVKMVSDSNYDVVLMDIQMPEMDGHAATRQIRADGRFNDLPIIAMTANAMTGDREKSLASGMNDHVSKPIDKKRLFNALVKLIPHREQPTEKRTKLNKESVGTEFRLPQVLPGIDVDAALQRVSNNHKLCQSILFEFHRDFASSATDIRKIMGDGKQQNDPEAAIRLVHAVKGMSGNFAADGLFDAALKLESGIKQNRLQDLPILLDTFELNLNQIVQSIGILKLAAEDAWLENVSVATASKPIAKEVIIPIFKELSELLLDDNSEAQYSFETLKPLLAGADPHILKELHKLEMSVDIFDFEDAHTALLKMAEKLEITL